MLEMDRLDRQLVNLPLLHDASSYVPDTVDLTEDAMAREYWLSCFEDALDGVSYIYVGIAYNLYCQNRHFDATGLCWPLFFPCVVIKSPPKYTCDILHGLGSCCCCDRNTLLHLPRMKPIILKGINLKCHLFLFARDAV